MSGSWADLLPDIGYMVLDKLPEVVEHIRFAAVCKQWRKISKYYHTAIRPNRKVLPMLLVPSPEAPVKRDPPRLFALSCLGKYYSTLQPRVPFNSERYWGSSYGWIAIENDDRSITLVNPFSPEVTTIHLPGIKNWRRPEFCFNVGKVFLSPDSRPDNYIVVAIYLGASELATIKSGEESWSYVPPRHETAPASLFTDVTFFRGRVYAVTANSMIVRVDIHARPPKVKILHPLNRELRVCRTYLVESTSSDLFFLRRCYNRDRDPSEDIATIGFNVFKLRLYNGKAELIDQKTLNGDAFFVGDNTSVAVQAHNCRANSIYFTDDLHDPGYGKENGPIDTGCYSVEDGTITPFYKANPVHKNGVAGPIWISPY